MMRALLANSTFFIKVSSALLVVALVMGFSTWAAHAQEADALTAEKIEAAERAAHRGPFPADGTFVGSAQGYGGLVSVQVQVTDGYIDSLTLLDASHEDKAWLDMASTLLATIPDKQTTNVDVVSGATFTSSGIINATKSALSGSAAF